jgi:YggT family protein
VGVPDVFFARACAALPQGQVTTRYFPAIPPETLMRAVLDIILILLQLYWWVLLIMIIMSWLISFNVINTRNQFVATVWQVLNQLTEPVLKPIRRFMPNFSGLDLSPLIAFLLIFFIQSIIGYYIYPAVARAGI